MRNPKQPPNKDKNAILLKVDPYLAAQARLLFPREMSKLFESAIKAAIAQKKPANIK